MSTGSLAQFALLLSVLLGCAAPARPDAREHVGADSASTPTVAPGDAVITIHGFCAAGTPASPTTPCNTVITRAQFDKLADALEPDMPRPLRLKVATSYARMMRMAAAAEKRGLDKTAAFAEELRYARLQLLSQDLTRVLEEEAHNVSDAEVADYYKQHERDFEHATLARIFVPGAKGMPDEAAAGGDGANLAEFAVVLRRRAVAGESPDALQLEAFEAAGMKAADPHTKLENIQRDSLPPTHESVMDLRAGEVSEVLSDPGGGHFIYKMIGKDTSTLQELAPEIRKRISSQRYRESLQPVEGDVVFNDAYFDPPGSERTSPAGIRRPHSARRSAPH